MEEETMKKTATRILALFLMGLMLSSTVACGGNTPAITTDPSKGTDSTTKTTETDVVTEAIPGIWAPDDWNKLLGSGDYTCNILLGLTTLGRDEFKTESSATVFDAAVFRRTQQMMDLGVCMETEVHLTGGFSAYTRLNEQYTAGDTDYDFTIARSYDVAKLTTAGYLYDLNTLDNLDLSNPWWDETVTRDCTIGNSVYFTSGDISTLVNDFVCCIAVNKKLFSEVTGETTTTLYNTIGEGKWTLDVLDKYAKMLSEDLNNDEILDSRDKFGLAVWDSRVIAAIHGCGGKVVTINDKGELTLTLNTERNAQGVEKFLEMCMNPYVLNMSGMTGGKSWKTLFPDEQLMFSMSSFNSLSDYRNLENADYGILPQPKTFEDQDNYYSSIVSTHACFFAMPLMQENAERTAAIAEALGYLGQEYLTPAYYTKTLEGQYIRDNESADSIRICFDGKVVDLGDYFSIGTYYKQLAQLLDNRNPTGFASMYETYRKAAETALSSLNEQMQSH